MSGYREKESLRETHWPADRWTLPYISARLGFGLLAIALFKLVIGGSLIFCGITALVGAALLAYGVRNY